MALKYTSLVNVSPLYGQGGPLDIRTVVQSTSDLMTSEISRYVGLVAYVIDESELYVCFATGRSANTLEKSWKKVGGSEFNPEDYAENFGARVLSSTDDLTSESLLFPYKGMFAVVEDNPETSEDEGGLYVLTKTPHTVAENWKKVLGTTTTSETVNQYFTYNVTNVVNPDEVTDGLTIGTDANTTVYDYVTAENPIKKNYMYTSNGMGSESGETTPAYIKLYPAGSDGSSYVTLYDTNEGNWISITITDDSLGFTESDIFVEGESETLAYQSGDALPYGTSIAFTKDVDFTGWTVEDPEGNKTVFGEGAYNYDIVDIYKESAVPVAYISVNGSTERVLTESDKVDIEEKIADASNNIKVDYTDGAESETENITIQEFVTTITQTITEIREVTPEEITDEQLEGLFE